MVGRPDEHAASIDDDRGDQDLYPPCDILNSDFTADSAVNGQDIDGFVAALFGG